MPNPEDPKTRFEFEGVEMEDAPGPPDQKFTAEVIQESHGLSILIPGHGTNDMVPGAGPVVLLEFRAGVPHLVVWADITTEEPTHSISLEGASEKFRPDDEPEPPRRPVDQPDDTDPHNPVDNSREDWQDIYAKNPDLLDYDQEP